MNPGDGGGEVDIVKKLQARKGLPTWMSNAIGAMIRKTVASHDGDLPDRLKFRLTNT